MIEKKQIRAAMHDVNLTVTQTGMKIVVVAGKFIFDREELTLPVSQEFEARTLPHDCFLKAFLLRNTKTGDVFVMVDEIEADGFDEAMDFGKLPDTEILWRIFNGNVPANSTTLDTVPIECRCTVPVTIRESQVKEGVRSDG